MYSRGIVRFEGSLRNFFARAPTTHSMQLRPASTRGELGRVRPVVFCARPGPFVHQRAPAAVAMNELVQRRPPDTNNTSVSRGPESIAFVVGACRRAYALRRRCTRPNSAMSAPVGTHIARFRRASSAGGSAQSVWHHGRGGHARMSACRDIAARSPADQHTTRGDHEHAQ
jgi:hypothetical protein